MPETSITDGVVGRDVYSLQDHPHASPQVYIPAVSIEERVHHDDHILFWQARGRTDLILDGDAWALEAGHALWLPPRVHHAFHVHPDSAMLPMFFPVSEIATTLHDIMMISVDRQLRTLFLVQLQSEWSIIRPAADVPRQILSLLERQPLLKFPPPMPVSDAARTTAEHLRFNPGDGRSVGELAEAEHTSERTIERAFKAETGLTLRQWRLQNRMEAAGTLLRTSTNLMAVARRVGYTNFSAFGRAFKNHYEMTPTEYIARYRGSD